MEHARDMDSGLLFFLLLAALGALAIVYNISAMCAAAYNGDGGPEPVAPVVPQPVKTGPMGLPRNNSGHHMLTASQDVEAGLPRPMPKVKKGGGKKMRAPGHCETHTSEPLIAPKVRRAR